MIRTIAPWLMLVVGIYLYGEWTRMQGADEVIHRIEQKRQTAMSEKAIIEDEINALDNTDLRDRVSRWVRPGS